MRTRRTAAVLMAMTTMSVGLAACGSDAPAKTIPGPNFATITAPAGKFAVPANPQRTKYPNACKLLTRNSAQALLGSPAEPGRNPVGCAWTTKSATSPTLQISFVEIGSDAGSAFSRARRADSTTLSGVGARAVRYRLNNNKSVLVDALKGRVFYRVTVGTPSTAPQDLQRIDAIAKRTAQLVASQLR